MGVPGYPEFVMVGSPEAAAMTAAAEVKAVAAPAAIPKEAV
jgi:hypothetical protein